MDKSGHQIGISPLAKISPLTAVASVASPIQALESRAEHLAKQHADLMAKIAVIKTESFPGKSTSTASVSDAAKLINASLQQAEANGVAVKYHAQTTLTHHPKLPALVSQQLKAAISNSGLFYESHLRDFIDGHRHINTIKMEPQNQFQHVAQSLLPQQLHILEHQRISWHGEVWPHQQMDWDVYCQHKQEDADKHTQQDGDSTPTIASDLTLHLPHLGKVTAKISLKNGRMHIGMFAEDNASLQLMREKSAALATAVESNGQRLTGLTVESLMRKEALSVDLLEVRDD
jgi:uncharacterized protein YoxC